MDLKSPEGLSCADSRKEEALPVKICGLTDPDEAAECAALGASAIGCVFYPPSPRHVSDGMGREIVRSLPIGVAAVGVFVNEPFEAIMRRVEFCGIRVAQLHGVESPQLAEQLAREGVRVIKALFINGTPALKAAGDYRVSAFLVECAGGLLPGGNAMVWDWGAARELTRRYPVILAGGLNAENAARAIEAAHPDALDVSSGVEASPGRKDLARVKRFLETIASLPLAVRGRSVFA